MVGWVWYSSPVAVNFVLLLYRRPSFSRSRSACFRRRSFGYACCTEFFNGDLFGGCKAGVEPSYGNDAVAGFNDMKVAAFGGAVASAFAQMVAFECVVVYRCNRGNPEGV